ESKSGIKEADPPRQVAEATNDAQPAVPQKSDPPSPVSRPISVAHVNGKSHSPIPVAVRTSSSSPTPADQHTPRASMHVSPLSTSPQQSPHMLEAHSGVITPRARRQRAGSDSVSFSSQVRYYPDNARHDAVDDRDGVDEEDRISLDAVSDSSRLQANELQR